MRTLIVPCAGERRIHGIPLLLLEHPKDGIPLYYRVIEGIYPESYDQIVYVFRKEIDEEFGVKNKIIENIHRINDRLNVKVVLLESVTSGAAETVYCAIQKCSLQGEISIKDSHAYTKTANACHGNFISSLDLLKDGYFIDDLRTKSFIVSNEQGQILDVIEKKFRSDVISAGLYGIKKCEDFIEAYERLSDKTYHIDKLYVSHIISYLIGYKERIFHSYEVEDFEEWGSSRIWSSLQRKYANYYLDVEKLFGSGLKPSGKTLDILCERSKAGASFVAILHREIFGRDIVCELREMGINCVSVVYGCNRSTENIFIETALDLESKGL